MPIPQTVPVHDAVVVCALINPEVLQDCIKVDVDISFSPGITDGMSLLDTGGRDKNIKPNVVVAKSADRTLFLRMLKQILNHSK